MLNKVLLIGNLTKKPEKPRPVGETTVTDFRMAVTERFGSRDSGKKERTLFIDVAVWGRMGENCYEYLDKGHPVFVEGRLEIDEWDDKETGQKRSKPRVTATSVQFLPKRDGSGGGGGQHTADDDAADDEPRPSRPNTRRDSDSGGASGGHGDDRREGPPPASSKLKDYGFEDVPF